MESSSTPLFLLGAGFGANARALAGSIREYEIQCAYPLLRDLPRICFPDSDPPLPPDQVESRLAAALDTKKRKPVDLLCQELMKADYYLATRLVSAIAAPNPYSRLFADFPSSSFLTYNYDAFVEFALFQAGRWSPHDGYGVKVAAELGYTASPYAVRKSTNLVLHLHGSLLVYTQEFEFGPSDTAGMRWMTQLEPAHFNFDPDSLGNLFYPFTRVTGGLGYRHDLTERVLAPIPDKTPGLRGDFVLAVRRKAVELLRQHKTLVIVGYGFGPTDAGSYDELLNALSSQGIPEAVVVSPDATRLTARLAQTHPRIQWHPQDLEFADWVRNDYPGLLRPCDV